MSVVNKIEEALINIDDCITMPEAEKLLENRFSKPTMINWCKQYKIGVKVGGKWYVHPQKLALLVSGNLKTNLISKKNRGIK